MPSETSRRQAIAVIVLAALILSISAFVAWFILRGSGGSTVIVVSEPPGSANARQPVNPAADNPQIAAQLRAIGNAIMLYRAPIVVGVLPASRPAATLDLTVLDARTNRPIPGAAILSGFNNQRFRGTTAANGHIYVPMPTGKFNIFNIAVRARRYAPERLWYYSGEFTGGRTLPTSYTLQLQRAQTIGGAVVDENGSPVAGATVSLYVAGRSLQPNAYYDGNGTSGVRTLKTNAQGNWTYGGVPPQCDEIDVAVSATGYVNDLADLKPYPDQPQLFARTATFHLSHGVPMTGTVLGPDGQPVPGAAIILGSAIPNLTTAPPLVTDPAGKFSTRFTPQKQVILTVQADSLAPQLQRFTMPSTPQDLDIHLTAGQPLLAKVLDAAGRPLANIQIAVHSWRGVRTLRANFKTDANGQFTWSHAPPGPVEYELLDPSAGGPMTFTLTASDQPAIICPVPPVHVHGTITDSKTGKPIDGVTLRIGVDSSSRGAALAVGRPIVVPDGQFHLQTPPYDGLILWAHAPGYQWNMTDGIDATKDAAVDIKLDPAGPPPSAVP